MTARDSARTLELVIRGAMAEERLLGARLARMAESQRRTREDIDRARATPNGASPPAPGWRRRTAAG